MTDEGVEAEVSVMDGAADAVVAGKIEPAGKPMKVGIECYVELAGVTVESVLLGQSITVKSDAWAYRIDLPQEPDSFKFMRTGNPVGPPDEREYLPTRAYVGDPDRGFLDIRIVRVVVNATYDFLATYDKDNQEHDAWAQQVFYEVRGRALQAVRDFTDLVRLRGQPTIEPTGRYPRVINMAQLLRLDGDEARSFGWSIGQGGTIQIIDSEEILDQARLDTIENDLRNQRSAWVGELLVGEAMYLVRSAQQTGPAQATLLAAMGVEVHTKDVLRYLASDDQRPLLDLLLDNPRDWSMAAHGLFQKTLPKIARTDLGPDHKTLSPRVQKLFEARNKVAHRGESIGEEQAVVHVATAKEAIEFLRSLVWQAPS